MSSNNKDKINLFIDDAKEQIDEMVRNLLLLEETDGTDSLLVNKIFRGINTIKGGADFLGLEEIKQLSHSVEDVLDLVRNQQVILTQYGIEILLVATDYLKEMLMEPGQSLVDIANLVEDIDKLSEIPSCNVLNTEVSDMEQLKSGPPSAPELFSIPVKEYENYQQKSFNFFFLELNHSDDPEQTELRESALKTVEDIGYILEGQASVDDSFLYVLFRTVLTRTLTISYLGLSPSSLYNYSDKRNIAIQDDTSAISSSQE